MSHKKTYVFWFLLGVGSFCFGQAKAVNPPNGSGNFLAEEEVSNPNWPAAGFHYSKLLLDGPSAAHYQALGELFFSESYPKHASFYFELASTLDPQNEEVKAAWQKAQDRINYLEERFFEFSEKAGVDNDPTYFGRIAAIRFHLGDRREGIRILKDALGTFNRDGRLMPLVGTFQKQMQTEGYAVQGLYSQFQKALEAKDVKKATNLLGQISFISLGHTQILDLLEMTEKAFPKKLNEESAVLLTEFSRQFNQIDLPKKKSE